MIERLAALFVLLSMGLVVGCDRGEGRTSPTAAQAEVPETAAAAGAPRTATTVLPDRTNNAWALTPFKLRGLDGRLHTLDEWKGKVIMMNFWASWCAPCQYEIPEFVDYQKRYGDKGLQLIGIGVDEQRKLANVARSLHINYPVLVLEPSAARPLMARWGNDTGIIPYTVIIDRDGTIRYIHRGTFDHEAFQTYVEPLLKKP